MEKLLLFICALMLLTACNKKYRYVEIVQEQSDLGGSSETEKNEKTISASSDSAAYIEAFSKFCISQKVYSDMRKKGMADNLAIPIGFKLYNSEGVDISDIVFASKKQKEDELIARFMSMDNVFGNSKGNSNSRNTIIESKIDSAKIKELLPFFDVKKDEFDPNGKTWYKPKSAPKYTNLNGIYLYFAALEGKVMPLRFRVQYYSDDWLFFNKIQFSIDDKAYEYIPSHTETDSGNGGKKWEWFDEALTGSDKDLIYALVGAKAAKMKFIGRQYYDIKKITNNQVIDMKKTIELYRAMGGIY